MNREIDLLVARHITHNVMGRSEYYYDGILEWFHPSTNIEHAWKVIEYLRSGYCEVEVYVGVDEYSVKINDFPHDDCDIKSYCEDNENLPLAICHVALRYKGVEY